MRFTKQRNKNCVKLRRLLFSNVLLLGWLSCSDLATASDTVGPLVGTVDATSARLLYRADASEQPLRLTLLLDGKVIRQVTVSSKKEDDYVAKFEFKKLQPATQYHYRIDSAHSQKTFVETDEEHTFMTANPKRLGHRVSVGFVSCVDIEPNRIWKEMEDLGLDTICLLGDTPYIDKSDLEAVRARHRDFLQQSDLATLAAHTPIVGTWDDHDFGRNNGNGRNMMNGKRATRRGFVNYRAHSQYGTGSEGIYHTIDLGMIEVFLLDPRYFSQIEPSPVDETKPTCFGPQQWNWLLAALRDSKAPFKVLAMGAIWQDKKNRETDDMFTYWYERDALLDIVKNEQISGVVLLGGDIHVARHLIHPQRVGYDLHDFVISPGHKRTITELDVYHPSLEWSLVEGWQFLTLTADGSMESPTLTAEYRQPDGVVNRKVEIPLKSLTSNNQPSIEPSLRAHWSFDRDLKNRSALNRRIDAVAMNGAKVESDSGVSGGALKLERSRQQFVNVSRSFLDETSTGHTVSLWFKPSSLPAHGSPERHFLLESTAEGKPIAKQ
ncbi:MAG: alkaline phosphatase, partial [Rubripirellula sp.]